MKFLIVFITSFLFGFDVEFNDSFFKFITPNQKAILLTKPIQIEYNPKIYTPKGVVLLNYEKADNFIRNDFYLPNGVKLKEINIAIFDIDKFRNQTIKTLKQKYKNCNIKKIIFLNNLNKIYFKQTKIELKIKTILDCKN